MAEVFIMSATAIAAIYFVRMAVVDYLTSVDFKGEGE